MSWERSGVPGGYTGTDWHRHDVPTMWHAVEGQHTDNHWRLVSGWRRTAELTATHLSRLEQYRANLIAAWPPDRNAAAAAYVSRLDFLIQNVRTTHEVAVANYTTFGATVGALAGAQRELKPLYDEWMRTRQAIRDHDAMMAHNAASEAVSTVWRAPATQADLEVLNNRARAIMFSLSQTLIEAEAAIKQPPTYPSGSPSENFIPDVYGASNTRSGVRSPSPASTAGGDQAGASRYTSPASGRTTAIDSLAKQRVEASPARATGRPPFAPGHSRPGPVAPGAPVRSDLADSYWKPQGGLSAGTIIGAAQAIRNTPQAHENPARINPIGGVIGGAPTTPSPTMLAGSQPSMARKDHRGRGARGELWEVVEGVPTVLQPPKHPDSIDPGPAIGLSR